MKNGTCRITIITAMCFALVTAACEIEADRTDSVLTIKNQSFSDLQDVQWQGVNFASNAIDKTIPIGNTVTKTVTPGYGHIYFKRKSNPAFARTNETVTVTKNKEIIFGFTDNTGIVEANNPDNTGTLKDMVTTVAFFDNAEGELQGYAEFKGGSHYSKENKESELHNYYASYYRSYLYYEPYTGAGKSIAIGGDTDAKLRLILNLDRKAKFSFWYANRDYKDGSTYRTNGATVSIDGTQQDTWQGDYNWGRQEYVLNAGSHEITWAKHGYYAASNYYYCTYLSLDNILAVYIE
jgi:hypothetical protein